MDENQARLNAVIQEYENLHNILRTRCANLASDIAAKDVKIAALTAEIESMKAKPKKVKPEAPAV